MPGLDAQRDKSFEFGAAQLLFDPKGQRLLMGGVVKPDRRELLPARIWNVATQEVEILKLITKGPVAFQDGVPIDLHIDEKGELVVRNLKSGNVLRAFNLPAGYSLSANASATMSPDGAIVGSRSRWCRSSGGTGRLGRAKRETAQASCLDGSRPRPFLPIRDLWQQATRQDTSRSGR